MTTTPVTVDLSKLPQIADLIDRLTGGDGYPEPLSGCDESASCPMACWYCGEEATYESRRAGGGGYVVTHADDCPWVEARRLLGKPIEWAE